MSLSVSKIELFTADIPFKTGFRHAAKERRSSESVFVRLEAKSGEAGFGESLPRPYVTGEDQASVLAVLKKTLPDLLLGKRFRSFDEVVDFAGSFEGLRGAAKCAFELALLDSAGKAFKCSLDKALGGKNEERLRYSAAIGEDSICKTRMSALKFRLYGVKDIKLKVGGKEDAERLMTARRFLGNDRDIRLDANCAWTAEEAIDKLAAMRKSRFSVIEQPVGKDDIDSLKRVSDAIPEPVMADESMCDMKDAERLVSGNACGMFNIRISKCGGLLDSLKIAKFAAKSGMPYQLGCQVGETGILSAAGRHFASCVSGIGYLEGSYAKFLLAEDIVAEDVSFGYGGFARPIDGVGLGVTVDEDALRKYVGEKITIT